MVKRLLSLKIRPSSEAPVIVVLADASLETQYTSGQAAVAARCIDEQGFNTALLVTTAYHQPRAYMTLLKSLIKRGIEKRVQLKARGFTRSRS